MPIHRIGASRITRPTRATLLAFAVALLWTVHPLQTEAVTYIVQRTESLMGLFYLLTLYCFIRGAECQTPKFGSVNHKDTKAPKHETSRVQGPALCLWAFVVQESPEAHGGLPSASSPACWAWPARR